MNRAEQGPTGLDVADIAAKVGGLLRDTDLATSVTVTTPTGTSLDAASGTLTRTITSDSVEAYFGPLSAREVEANSAYQLGDWSCCVMAADLTVEPTVYSWVVVSGEKYAVLSVERDPLGVYREMVVRRMDQD